MNPGFGRHHRQADQAFQHNTPRALADRRKFPLGIMAIEHVEVPDRQTRPHNSGKEMIKHGSPGKVAPCTEYSSAPGQSAAWKPGMTTIPPWSISPASA